MFCFVLILSSILIYCQAKDYCRNDLCRQGFTHIACANKGTFGSKCAANAAIMQIDQSAKDYMVNEHNLFRQKWASGKGNEERKACAMATMAWDEDLAYLAELNVRSCTMEHDLCRNTEKYPESGQNVFQFKTIRYKNKQTPEELFKQAFSEFTKQEGQITYADLMKIQTVERLKQIGHSTILIIEKNSRVGCAIVTHRRKRLVRFYHVTCNYAANNRLGQDVYSKCPQPGSKCPSGISSQYPPLCA